MSTKAQVFQRACRARLTAPEIRHTNNRLHKGYSTPDHACYSTTQSANGPGTSRRAITVTTDDGRYAWSELSTGEKAARSTQQSLNFLLVVAGAAGTVRNIT